MRLPTSALLTLALLLPPAPGRGQAVAARAATPGEALHSIESQLRLGERLFEAWQFDAAIKLAETLYTQHPALPPVQALAARAKFYQQDYEGAQRLFERAGLGRPKRLGADPIHTRTKMTQTLTQDYVSVRSKHFELRVPAGVDEVLPPYALPALEAAWQRIGDDFNYHPTRPIVVEAYARPSDLSKATGLPAEAIKTSGTIAICKYNKLMFTSPKALLRGYDWLDTLAHEYVHYVVSRVSWNSVPIWLHEGLAKYEETRWNGAAGRALSPYSEQLLAEAVRGKRRFISFKEMSPSMALLPSQEATALAFAEVFSLVQYLVEARGGTPVLRALLKTLKGGSSDRAAIHSVLGQSFHALQRDWKRWLRERPTKARPGAPAPTLTFREDLKKKPRLGQGSEPAQDSQDSEDEAHALGTNVSKTAKRFAHLGELLRIEGRPAAAVLEYEKAFQETGPSAVHLANKLARTHLKLGHYERAETVLKQALGPDPSLVTTHINLGRTYLATKRPEEAILSYQRALELNPFVPEVHAALASLFKAAGKLKRAKEEARAYTLCSATRHAVRRRRSGHGPSNREHAELSIHSSRWARLRIDGKDSGLTTPIFRHPLSPGDHALVFEIDGQVVLRKQVHLDPGAFLSLELALEVPASKQSSPSGNKGDTSAPKPDSTGRP